MTSKYEEGSKVAYDIFEKAFIECGEQLVVKNGYGEAIAMGIIASVLKDMLAGIFALCDDPYSKLDNHVIKLNKRITDIVNYENRGIK